MIRKAAITFFGLGYLRPAPGTWGSLGAIVVAAAGYAGLRAAGATAWFDAALIAGILLSCVLSVAFGPWAIEYYSAKARKPGDPGHFVLDEVAGQWLSLLFLPISAVAWPGTAAGVFAAQFFLFRIFDILKPPPARQFERLPAGWGVLCDDLASAVYVNLIGQVVMRLWLVG